MLNIFKKRKNDKYINDNDFTNVKIGDTLLDLYSGTDVTVIALSKNFPDKICVSNYRGILAWIPTTMLRRKKQC